MAEQCTVELPAYIATFTVHSTSASNGSYFLGPECTLVLEAPAARVTAAASEFADLYGLSPAECRVVEAIASGITLEDAATQGGVTIHTVRAQLKSVFAKSDLTRQADVAAQVAFMAGGTSVS